jgi:uncharacterized protein (DUF1697 family)
MQKYVAFISGLPFGQNSVSDDKLNLAIARLGFTNVEVVLRSGNVVFDSAPVGVIGPLEAQISRHLRNTFGIENVWTFIRTPQELKAIIEGVPFSEADLSDKGNSTYVVLLSDELDRLAAERIQIRRNDIDELKPSGRAVYWLRRSTRREHIAPPSVSEILDTPATVRSLHAIVQIVNQIEHPATTKPKLIKLEDAIRSERSRQ